MQAARSVLFAVLFYAWTVAVAVICTPILAGPTHWTLVMFHLWGQGVMALLRVAGVRVEVRGQQYVPSGAALVAPKHQSMYDVFAQFTVLPASAFVMKKELTRIPWFGWYAAKAGAIDVDRGGHSSALRKMVREAKALFAEGRQVVIFPEGTRKAPGDAPDYKPGIAALYRELDVPVCPVATNSGEHWPRRGFLIEKPGTIVFEYLEPIPPGLKRAEFMRLLEARTEAATARLSGL